MYIDNYTIVLFIFAITTCKTLFAQATDIIFESQYAY